MNATLCSHKLYKITAIGQQISPRLQRNLMQYKVCDEIIINISQATIFCVLEGN